MTDAATPTSHGVAHRRVWTLAGPVILSNISIPLLGAVDTAVMGHLPDPAYLGGVAIGALIFSYIYWGFGFLRMGTTGFVAQAIGAKDVDEIRTILARAAVLALALAACVIAFQSPIGWTAFTLIEATTEVEALARSYFKIRVWGAPATLIVYVAIGWLFGLQRMGSVLVVMVSMNALNIALDLLFVVGLGWGIEGVAFATLISEWFAAGLAMTVIALRLRHVGGRWRRDRIADAAGILGLARVNFDIFVRTLCLISAFAVFIARGATLGETILAANAVLVNFQLFSAYALDGFAHAAEALVGSAVGARNRHSLRRAVRITTIWAAIFAALFSAVFLLFGVGIVNLLTSIEDVRASATDYLPWVIALPIVSVWSFQLDGIFIGATRGPEMRNGMIVSFAGFILAVWLLMPPFGNHGLWLAFTLFMGLRGVTLALWYPRVERAAV